ncbi:hypothetical protein X798_08156 [Onchocerca flexuosa]|uniref:Uncharacterized protein n=1 Tax=Onchocerca flexuosa TaxID=387005 RepID=A0A238BJ54_9BILA|nr:hypothetical protein X798_08156 [Onchocerca flexuosa]
MFETLVTVLEMIVFCRVKCIESRHTIAYVLVPLSSEATMRLGLKSNGSEIFIPCSNCFFKYDRSNNRLMQYYNRPSFGETPQLCGCFEYLSKGFMSTKTPTLISISRNIIQIEVNVMKTDQCRLDSIRSARTVDGLQLALQMRCS